MPVTSASITFRIISTSQPSIASIFFFGILSHTYVRAVEHAFTSDGIFAIDGLTKTMETIISFRCKLVLSVGLCSCAAWQQAQNEKNEFCQPKVIEMEYSGQQKKWTGRWPCMCVFKYRSNEWRTARFPKLPH